MRATDALDWLQKQQLLDEPADWQVNRPGLAGGGWAFQFANSYYPDLDDTAVVAWAMHQARDSARYSESVRRALDWLVGMQSKEGGFAAFDADNTCYYLNKIPFADHGALLDPPTSDVTARVVTVLARIGRPEDKEVPAQGGCLLAQRAGTRWLVAGPLGHELHLRHMVGADGFCSGAHRRR